MAENIITGEVVQSTVWDGIKPDTYRNKCPSLVGETAKCNKTNGVDDWKVATHGCGHSSDAWWCTKPDAGSCADIVGENATAPEPKTGAFKSALWDSSSPNLVCTFDLNKIKDTKTAVSKWKTFFKPKDYSGDYGKLVAKYCTEKSTLCPLDPDTMETMESCMRIQSPGVDDGGEFCNDFFQQQTQATKDNMILNFCRTNPNSPACKCVNRNHRTIMTTFFCLK
jgi:hypothetical protein